MDHSHSGEEVAMFNMFNDNQEFAYAKQKSGDYNDIKQITVRSHSNDRI